MSEQQVLLTNEVAVQPTKRKKRQAIVKAEPVAQVAIERVPLTPMSLIEMAITQKADIAQLERLFDLQLKWESNEAKKAFVDAMGRFKAEAPSISKNKHVNYTTKTGATVDYHHATLDNVCDSTIDELSKFGLSHRWTIRQDTAKIRVSCVITHKLGHSEETSLEAAADDSGGKNSIQAIASTVTYLERYTLLAATGMAAADTDNDGAGAAKPFGKLQEFLDAIGTAPNLGNLETTFKAAFKEAKAANNAGALKALVTAKDARKTQLQQEDAQ